MSQTDTPAPRYISLQDAAAYLGGCSETTVRRMIYSGAVTGYRLPGSRLLRIDLDQLAAAIKPVPVSDAAEAGAA